MSDEAGSGYCDTSSPEDGYLKQLFCGANAYVGGIASDAAEVLQSGVEKSNETIQRGLEEAGDTTRKGLNPLNLFGLGAGVAGGGTLAIAGIVTGTALAVDWLAFDGAATRSVVGAVRGRGRR